MNLFLETILDPFLSLPILRFFFYVYAIVLPFFIVQAGLPVTIYLKREKRTTFTDMFRTTRESFRIFISKHDSLDRRKYFKRSFFLPRENIVPVRLAWSFFFLFFKFVKQRFRESYVAEVSKSLVLLFFFSRKIDPVLWDWMIKDSKSWKLDLLLSTRCNNELISYFKFSTLFNYKINYIF